MCSIELSLSPTELFCLQNQPRSRIVKYAILFVSIFVANVIAHAFLARFNLPKPVVRAKYIKQILIRCFVIVATRLANRLACNIERYVDV